MNHNYDILTSPNIEHGPVQAKVTDLLYSGNWVVSEKGGHRLIKPEVAYIGAKGGIYLWEFHRGEYQWVYSGIYENWDTYRNKLSSYKIFKQSLGRS